MSERDRSRTPTYAERAPGAPRRERRRRSSREALGELVRTGQPPEPRSHAQRLADIEARLLELEAEREREAQRMAGLEQRERAIAGELAEVRRLLAIGGAGE